MKYELTFTTYLITNSKNGTLYVGHTDNINARMEQHISGAFTGFSKQHGLKHIIWKQDYGTREEAFTKERQIKNWNRQWKINLIERENPEWVDIYTAPVWPMPDRTLFAELYQECLKHCVGPALRRDERR